jgi:single-strand DNA-binding protein
MNNVSLTGRLTQNVTVRSTSDGTTVGTMRIAVQRPRKDGADQGADYVDVTVFGRQADTCAQYLAKGRKVGIEGHLHHSEWDSDNGHRQRLEVVARNVEFLDAAKRDDIDTEPTEATEAAPAAA